MWVARGTFKIGGISIMESGSHIAVGRTSTPCPIRRNRITGGRNVLYLFDLDNTLISGYMDNPDKNYDAWKVLPGRRARLNQLLMQGHKVAIITNQGGVAFGIVSERACDAKLTQAIRALGLSNP